MASDPDPKDIQAQRAGSAAHNLLIYLEEHLSTRRNTIISRVFHRFEAHEGLSAEHAIQAWMQLYELESFARSLRKKETAGENASKRLS